MKEIPLLWSVNSYLAPYGGLCAPHREPTLFTSISYHPCPFRRASFQFPPNLKSFSRAFLLIRSCRIGFHAFRGSGILLNSVAPSEIGLWLVGPWACFAAVPVSQIQAMFFIIARQLKLIKNIDRDKTKVTRRPTDTKSPQAGARRKDETERIYGNAERGCGLH